MTNVKDSLSFKKVTKRAETKEWESLTVRGRPEKKKNNKGNKRGKYKSKNKILKCFQCHKERHFKRDCPGRNNKSKNRHGKNRDAIITSEDECYDSAGVLLAARIQTNSKWVIDSGCTYHMCLDKHLCVNYKPFNGGEVMIGNNSMCKVIGLGTIRLKMFNGMIRELKMSDMFLILKGI